MNATMKLFAALALALVLAACSGAPQPVTTKTPSRASIKSPAPIPAASPASPVKPAETERVATEAFQDPHSYARPQEATVEHLKLDLAVDFQARRLTGRASLRVKNSLGVDH